jgi:enoyl-CoA hydratase/carnithine racemase
MSDVAVQQDGAILEVRLERPARRNALTWEMYAALDDAFVRAQQDDSVRVVLLAGSDTVFTAGNDLEDFVQRPPLGDDTPVFRFLHTVARAAKPIVAAVNGAAVGLGTTVLLHCDLVYAGSGARFQLPFTKLALVPEFASTYLLPALVGYQRAAELLLLGEPFDAQHAQAIGLVNRVLPDVEVKAAARDAAARIAALPPASVQATKALMKAAQRETVERALLAESEQFRKLLTEPAARAAFESFLARRDTSRHKS